MGVLPDIATHIEALRLPKGFSVCELGNQEISGAIKGVPAQSWYASIGCGRYESIDGNGRGTITWDLNHPVHDDLQRQRTELARGSFDLVTDIGTGEHVFDQASIWRTLHWLVKPGGYIVFDRPTTDYPKHCFYLINECLIRDLASANGYELVWLSRRSMERGELLRGCFKTPTKHRPFRVPQQGKYKPDLVIGQ